MGCEEERGETSLRTTAAGHVHCIVCLVSRGRPRLLARVGMQSSVHSSVPQEPLR